MCKLGKLLRSVPKEEMEGIHLNTEEPYWELDGPDTFKDMFSTLKGWLPENSILYFEGGYPDEEIETFISTYSVPEVSHVAMGTIWPRPKVSHVPATDSNLGRLAEIMSNHAEPELPDHFHVYCDDKILIEWHDAFSQPLLMSGSFSEEKVKAFTDKIGKSYRKCVDEKK